MTEDEGIELGLFTMDSNAAEQTAINFLEQRHYTVSDAHAILKGKYWIVSANIESTNKQVKEVWIDAKIGKIILHYSPTRLGQIPQLYTKNSNLQIPSWQK
jgi:hypothetical protein